MFVVADDESPYAREVAAGWPYYHAKIQAEEWTRQFANETGLDVICLRPTLLLGPGEEGSSILA